MTTGRGATTAGAATMTAGRGAGATTTAGGGEATSTGAAGGPATTTRCAHPLARRAAMIAKVVKLRMPIPWIGEAAS
jgi:hypothetical protein